MGVYTIRSYEDDAELAHILYSEVWGEHVAFPSQEEVDKTGLTLDKLAEKGKSFKLPRPVYIQPLTKGRQMWGP
eukprot:1019610-Amphidinium_carterae.1